MTFPPIAGLLIVLALPGAAGAVDLDWGPATQIDNTASMPIRAYACATATQCTVVDGAASALTFDPTAPGTEQRVPLAGKVIPGSYLANVTCPTTTACVAAAHGVPNGMSNVFTFDPQDPSSAKAAAIGEDLDAYTLECPSATQCTGAEGGAVVTFDPHVPGTPTPITLDAGDEVEGLACPTTTQCTATGNGGKIWTFNPQTLSSTPAMTGNLGFGVGYTVRSVTCPTTSQCTVVDQAHRMVTFDPHAPGHPPSTTIDGYSVSCVSATLCAFGGPSGNVVTFDPNNYPASQVTTPVGSTLVTVTCTPTSTRCLVLYVNGAGTIDLQAPSKPTLTTVDRSGAPLFGLTCPTATTCVALSFTRGVLAFDPRAPENATTAPSPVANPSAVACPAATQCTIADGDGSVTTFDPRAPGAPDATPVDAGHRPTALACPTTTQCTLVDQDGGQSTFNPQAPSASRRVVQGGATFTGVTCPSTSRCVAGGTSGQVAVFDPGAANPALFTIDPGYVLASPSCPSTTQCTLIDNAGARVTFNPSSPDSSLRTAPAVFDGDHLTVMIACPSTTDCVGATYGTAILEGNPQIADAWTLHPVAGASGMLGISCPATELCVATDTLGSVMVGTRAAVAVDTTPPARGAPTPPATAVPKPIAPAPAPAAAARASDATIKKALQKILAPSARKAKVKTVRASGYPFAWKAPTAGTLSLRWTTISRGKVVLVGSATVKAITAATKSTKLKLKLTAAGKKLLKRGRLRISARATYTMNGRKTVVAVKAFTLK
jgi:hypothetical protein